MHRAADHHEHAPCRHWCLMNDPTYLEAARSTRGTCDAANPQDAGKPRSSGASNSSPPVRASKPRDRKSDAGSPGTGRALPQGAAGSRSLLTNGESDV